MQRRLNHFMLLFIILAVVLNSAFHTTVVYADDGGTEPPTTGESTPPAEEGNSADEAEPAAEPAAQEPAAAPEEAEAPVVEVTTQAEPPAVEPAPAAEVLEQLPEDTELVVVNEAGEVQPLASAEAAEAVKTGDPIWCPATSDPTPGANGCTTTYGSLNALISALEADADSATPVYAGSGIIWVVDSTVPIIGYNGADDAQIEFDGAELTNLSGSGRSLTLRGGWNGTSGDSSITGTSLADVSMVFVNWTGDIAIENFNINAPGDGAGFGLYIENTGNVTLNNVSVTNVQENTDGFGDGAIVSTTGNVDINNSEFDGNHGDGLEVQTQGTIELDTVSTSFNTLTGAYLDSCRYGTVDPGLCAGTGAVNIFSSAFSDNGFSGLSVDAGGDIEVDGIEADRNSVRGAFLQSADEDGAGNVTVQNSEFNENSNGTGLNVFTSGDIELVSVDALSNDTGATLLTTYAAGTIEITDSNFGITGDGNNRTGLHAESGSTITLNNVDASDNGANGGYLEAEGNITVNNSTFNGNVQTSGSPADPGLYAWSSSGNITLNNVTANANVHGAGVVLLTNGAGAININGGSFNQNGTFGIQAGSENGDITLANLIASYNQVKGAYLGAFSGNIVIDNSTFVENGSYGIYAFTGEGNINLNLVTVLGSDGAVGPGADNLTDYGAVLETGGNVTVTNSTFQLNTEVGLGIISGGQVNLNNVVADQNGGNGVEVYSITTAGPICEGDEPVSITVTVDGGTFTNNGGYGLMVKPGPEGTLVFITSPDFGFGSNALGNYLLDLSQEFEDCTCTPEPEEPPVTKGPLVVDVPSTGGPTVEQDCDAYTSTILRLPNGTWVQVGCPFEGFSNLEEVTEQNLPGPLGAGTELSTAIVLGLTDAQGNVILNEDGTVTITFVLPEDDRGRTYSILFWDPKLNDGKGGWMELPIYEIGTTFPLHPENPEDQRTVLSGVKKIGNTITVTVDFSGVFALVSP